MAKEFAEFRGGQEINGKFNGEVTFSSDSLQELKKFVKTVVTLIREEVDEEELDSFNPTTLDEFNTFVAFINEKYNLDIEPAKKTPNKEKAGNKQSEAHKRREIARQEGALDTTSTHLATIADTGLGFGIFTSNVCKQLPAGIENYILDEQGRINLYDLTGGETPVEEVLKDVDALHTAFLMFLLERAENTSDIREMNSGNAIMPVYLPDVLRKMGIDPRPHGRDKETREHIKRNTDIALPALRLNKFMGFINPLRNVAARFGDDLYQIVGFHHYNRESETVYITAPYMLRLVEYAKLHAQKHAAIQNIFHANIMTENQTAVEVANRIAMGLITRGVTRPDSSTYNAQEKPRKKRTTKTAPDGTKTVEELTFAPEQEPTETKTIMDEDGNTITVTRPQPSAPKPFTWSYSFAGLIADCPQLQREIDAIRGGDYKDKSQRINKKLRDTFTAAIRIIMEKSEIPRYYKDLTIRTGRFNEFKAPTNSTLSDKLILQHYGKNPDFTD